ncbi:unnamed protein product, partial [Darwinula stevensoni]
MRALQGMACTFRITSHRLVRTAATKRLSSTDSVLTLLKWVERHISKRPMPEESSPLTWRAGKMMNLKSPMVVVSNRLPFILRKDEHGELQRKQCAGGLVTAVAPVVIQCGGLWVGWPGIHLDDPSQPVPESAPEDKGPSAGLRSDQVRLGSGATPGRRVSRHVDSRLLPVRQGRVVPVHVEEQMFDDYYNGCCNATFWPLFHSMPDRAVFQADKWESYSTVNAMFAYQTVEALKRLKAKEKEGEERIPLVWIHDYHLMLAANHIRQQCEEENLKCKLGFFLHIPFPPWDIFRLFPWDDEVLQGILGCDMVGFHIEDYCRNFLDCCQRRLGCRVDRVHNLVDVAERTVKVRALPIGIPYKRFEEMANAAPRALQSSQQIILGVDRLDYTKGLVNRIRSFERLLEKHPEHLGKVTLLQVAVPSRTDVKEYQQLKEQIDLEIGRINGRFSTPNWSPIRYIYGCISQDELAAFYRDSSVALVTPLRDGMNLVAKEYVACQVDKPGVLILSPFAGAGETMHEALLVNPYELDDVADTLHRALTMPDDEREMRMHHLKKREQTMNVDFWLNAFLKAMVHGLLFTPTALGLRDLKYYRIEKKISHFSLSSSWVKSMGEHQSMTMEEQLGNLHLDPYLKKAMGGIEALGGMDTGENEPMGTKTLGPMTMEDFDEVLSDYIGDTAKIALLLDYDGTLAPIAPKPDLALMPAETKNILVRLSNSSDVAIAIVSGRSLEDVRKMVGIDGITYAGNHGLEILHPDGSKFVHPVPEEYHEKMRNMCRELQDELCREGAWVENKGAILTYHFRAVPIQLRGSFKQRATAIISKNGFRAYPAHCAIEARPPVQWGKVSKEGAGTSPNGFLAFPTRQEFKRLNSQEGKKNASRDYWCQHWVKGRASIYILRTMFGVDWLERIRVIYVGDDVTDEDAMRTLQGVACTFRVTSHRLVRTAASKRLSSTDSVLTLLKWVERHIMKRQMLEESYSPTFHHANGNHSPEQNDADESEQKKRRRSSSIGRAPSVDLCHGGMRIEVSLDESSLDGSDLDCIRKKRRSSSFGLANPEVDCETIPEVNGPPSPLPILNWRYMAYGVERPRAVQEARLRAWPPPHPGRNWEHTDFLRLALGLKLREWCGTFLPHPERGGERVTEFCEKNRMGLSNLAIVFGPTLMWPESGDNLNMALNLMQQNLVVEALLVHFKDIF